MEQTYKTLLQTNIKELIKREWEKHRDVLHSLIESEYEETESKWVIFSTNTVSREDFFHNHHFGKDTTFNVYAGMEEGLCLKYPHEDISQDSLTLQTVNPANLMINYYSFLQKDIITENWPDFNGLELFNAWNNLINSSALSIGQIPTLSIYLSHQYSPEIRNVRGSIGSGHLMPKEISLRLKKDRQEVEASCRYSIDLPIAGRPEGKITTYHSSDPLIKLFDNALVGQVLEEDLISTLMSSRIYESGIDFKPVFPIDET